MRNIRPIIVSIFICFALTSNAQVKYIFMNISQPNIENCITGIENTFKDRDFKIYPNPSAGMFTIEIINVSSENKMDLFVFDINGKEIIREKIWINRKHIVYLDLSNNIKGMYILSIKGKNDCYFRANLVTN
jgi:hypothetical protein